ncbi:ATPase [gut metagenome]|uniref:ATPase n=1 Tax=gut metagenome TaxID=749906 RepID=J9FW35_9ZZZZ
MKPLTNANYIYRLIAEGEHQQQDFKFEISDARKIAKSLSAFANTDGGRLLIGVKDNGKIAGVQSEEEKYMIEAAAQLYCKPEVKYTLHSYIVEGRQVLVVDIPESPHKPVYAKDETGKPLAYLRIKDENILATPIHLRVWQQNNKRQGELICYTDREQLLLDWLEQGTLLSLNRYCRKTGVSRRAAEHLLAKLIRYDIVEPVFENHKFYFRIKKE